MTAKPPTPQEKEDIEEPGERSANRVTFVQVVALEAAIIAALWFLGRMFS